MISHIQLKRDKIERIVIFPFIKQSAYYNRVAKEMDCIEPTRILEANSLGFSLCKAISNHASKRLASMLAVSHNTPGQLHKNAVYLIQPTVQHFLLGTKPIQNVLRNARNGCKRKDASGITFICRTSEHFSTSSHKIRLINCRESTQNATKELITKIPRAAPAKSGRNIARIILELLGEVALVANESSISKLSENIEKNLLTTHKKNTANGDVFR